MGRASGSAATYEEVATLRVQRGQAPGPILHSQVRETREEGEKKRARRLGYVPKDRDDLINEDNRYPSIIAVEGGRRERRAE